ncbi:MAG TPA: hypothetical protein PLE30_00340 [Candidatus Kapabacteria bacterium]|nr:hypothetical protein [Candidatus Kapabacteria bacterium]
MRTIDILSSIEGREVLKELFFELKYKKQNNSLYVLFTLLRICTIENDLNKYSNLKINIEHNLGLIRGASLWMEEIVNRYYFSTINSFVYLGAAVLLVLIGLRRFSAHLTDEIVIGGVIFEACMLLLMFVVMLFSPEDDVNNINEKDQNQELLDEIGEIATDFSLSTNKLEELSSKYDEMLKLQKELLKKNDLYINDVQQTIKPNLEMLEAMRETNIEIKKLKDSFSNLNEQLAELKREEIERAVRKELEKMLSEKLIDDK